jgi:hypothetical protein
MLHLARVEKKINPEQLKLNILAHETTENLWEISSKNELIINDFSSGENFGEGLLVLLELDNQQNVISIKSASNWIIELVKSYLTSPILNGEFVKKEQEKVEEWRREMALQSQDLTRRNLELETRQEQLQELENKLKQQQKELEEFKLKHE